MITKSLTIVSTNKNKEYEKTLYSGCVKFSHSKGKYLLYNITREYALWLGNNWGVDVLYCTFEEVSDTELLFASESWTLNGLLHRLFYTSEEIEILPERKVISSLDERFGVKVKKNPYGIDNEEVRELVWESMSDKYTGKQQWESRFNIKKICLDLMK